MQAANPLSSSQITAPIDRVEPIDFERAREFVRQHHYSEVMPRITRVVLGGFVGERLVAIATFGFGTRPLHTIRKLFPSLGTDSYLELGKLCVIDEMPKNTESFFIARAVRHLKQHYPKVELLFSWADGIIGKPGYVYQASNFFYGGYIWSEMYLSPEGIRVHVRSIQGHPDLPKSAGKFKTRSYAEVSKLGFTKYFGLQFRYIYPLCSERRWRHIQAESTVQWRRGGYPKATDCKWKRQTGKGSREACECPPNIRTKYTVKPQPKPKAV